jgi:hypothetical protein
MYPHFGNTSSSRVEGNHHVIKTYLNTSTVDLLTVFDKMKLLLANQFVELSRAVETDKLKLSSVHDVPVMSSIVRRISKFALKKIKEQLDFLKEDDGEISVCLGSFS